MAVSLYDPRVLMGVIRNTPVKPQFMRDTFFKGLITHATDAVDVDVVKGKLRMAPYVSPVREGVVVGRDGYQTHTFKPGYTKVKRELRPEDTLVMAPGETIYDRVSPDARLRALIAQDLLDLNGMIDLTEEVMAAEAMTTGEINLRNEDNVIERNVNYGLDTSHKVTLSGTELWSATATADPIQNLQDWVQLIQADCGENADIILMAPDVEKALMKYFLSKNDQARMNALAVDRGTFTPSGPVVQGKAKFLGNLNEVGVPMYSYAATYTDLGGVTKPLIPSGKVVVASISAMQGKKQYGLIRDLKAIAGGPTAFVTDRFAKSWEEEDPSVRWLLVQSAPIMNPWNIGAYMFANVL